MRFRTLGLIAFTGSLLAAPLAFAEDKTNDSDIPGELTFTLSLTSDYTFRGISQTDSGPAIQGTVDYAYMFRDEIGIYAGLFGSNVDFDETSGPGVNRASAEFDLYGGIKGTISGVTWQLGYIYYAYPNAHPSSDFNYDYQEIVAK
ncbi:MAG TPA: TorF family putative porin, partial [Sphingomicrobium sp.]